MLTTCDCSLETNLVDFFIELSLFDLHLLKSAVTFSTFAVFKNKSLSEEEKSVAEFANLAGGALAPTINFPLWKEPGFLLVEAVFANCVATELTKIHVLLFLKCNKFARVAVWTFDL